MINAALVEALRKGGVVALAVLTLYEVHEIRTSIMALNAAIAVLVDRDALAGR